MVTEIDLGPIPKYYLDGDGVMVVTELTDPAAGPFVLVSDIQGATIKGTAESLRNLVLVLEDVVKSAMKPERGPEDYERFGAAQSIVQEFVLKDLKEAANCATCEDTDCAANPMAQGETR